jgi:hypothetical protein
MRRGADGLLVSTTVFDAATKHELVLIRCACRHWATHDPHGLWWLCYKRGWEGHFELLKPRFYCTRCYAVARERRRPVSIEGQQKGEATITLPMPPEREWKRALKRVRT